MMLCTTSLLIIITTASQVSTDEVDVNTIDEVVKNCSEEVKAFNAIEYKYSRGMPGPFEPLVSGPPAFDLLPIVYSRELNQRPIECVSDKLEGVSEEQLLKSSAYQELVKKCKSGRAPPKCNPSYKYSMINGTCNNIDNPEWGSVLCCARRLFPANYVGSAGIRKSVVDGKELPNARDISLTLSTDVSRPLKSISFLCVIFGQLLSHEMTDYAFLFLNGSEIQCCENPEGLPRHFLCAPIPVDDSFYKQHNVTCFNFYRKAMCDTCETGKRTSANQPTSYIDLSVVYGYGITDLRAHDGTGKMMAQYTKAAGELLPPNKEFMDACGDTKEGEYCFTAGDRRVNQQTPLTMMHTLFLREHNRICGELKSINPHWDDERLFQEARKINIAQMQVIVYKEFLPLIIGDKLISKYGLDINTPSTYDPQCDACILVEFNVAAYRLHSLIPGRIIFNTQGSSNTTRFRNMYGNSKPLYENDISSYLKQMSGHYSEKYDRYLTVEVTDYLYKNLRGDWGYDLATFDIQRGRDNGVPTYVQIIFYLYGKKITRFDDLHEFMDSECVELLQKLYADPADIDLWAALNCEHVLEGMLIAQTAAEIIATQFKRLKDCDRFYFSHDDKYFTPVQQTELKKTSIARLLCDNTNIWWIRPEAMQIPEHTVNDNLERPCWLIPGVNLKLWKEL